MKTSIHVYINDRTDLKAIRLRQPYLVEEPTMAILEEPSTFLHRHFVQSGRRSSPATWKAAAHDLVAWLEFLRAAEIEWRLATREDLIGYRDALLGSTSPHTGRPYAPVTVRNRMLTVIQFYAFGAEIGWYGGSVHTDDAVSHQLRTGLDRDALSHTRKGSPKTRMLNDLLPRTRKSRSGIRPFSVKEWRLFAKALGPLPSEQSKGDRRLCRDRLICEVAVWTGMRLAAVKQLQTLSFLSMHPDPAAPAAHQPLDIIAKRNKRITIRIPNWLVMEILAYIETERAELVKAAGLTGRREPRDLFLAGQNSRQIGNPFSARRYEQIVEEGCLAADLIEFETIKDVESGDETMIKRPKHSFHDLRHTYAVWTYWAERRNGNSEPWKRIQAQLGHENLSVTVDTYLSIVEIFEGFEPAIDVRSTIGI